jgi:hypothetical protein
MRQEIFPVCSVCGELNKHLTERLENYLAFKNQAILNYTYFACPGHEVMPIRCSRGRLLKYINGHSIKWRISDKNPVFANTKHEKQEKV